MKIFDIRTGQPFSGEPPKNTKIVPIENAGKKETSRLAAKVREVKALLEKEVPAASSLKERHLSIKASGKSLPGLINRMAKLLRDQY